MKELNSVQMGTSSGAIARLPRPVTFPSGRGCSRIRAIGTVPVKNPTAAPASITGADAKAAIECLFKTSTLKFGDRRQDVVDTALEFDRLRELTIAMTGDDFLVVGSDGAPKRLRDVADADVLFAAVAAGATVDMICEVVRPFELVRLGQDAYAYCPGASMMRQIQWEFIRGSSFGPTFVQGAAADLLFVADDFEAHDDAWPAVARLYQQEEAGRVSHGPKGPIGLIAMWEYSSAGKDTALTLFTVRRDGDVAVHDNVHAAIVVRDALYTDPAGFYDLNAIATVLVNLPADADKHDIPVGAGYRFEQTGAELNPPRTAWLHIPVRTTEETDALVGANVTDGSGVKVFNLAAKSGKALGSTAAALEPVGIAPNGTPDFEAIPGRLYVQGSPATTQIPPSVMQGARAMVGSAGSPASAAAAAEKASTALAKAVPGWLSGVRSRPTVARASIRSRILGR